MPDQAGIEFVSFYVCRAAPRSKDGSATPIRDKLKVPILMGVDTFCPFGRGEQRVLWPPECEGRIRSAEVGCELDADELLKVRR